MSKFIKTVFATLSLTTAYSYAETNIVDNTDGGFLVTEGNWVSSTFWPGFLGTDYLAADAPPATVAEARWTLSLSEIGSYDVAARWTAADNRSTQATYTVTDDFGDHSVVVNQQQNNAIWVSLGQFTNPVSVTLSNVGADGYVIADAVRAVSVETSAQGTVVTTCIPKEVNFFPENSVTQTISGSGYITHFTARSATDNGGNSTAFRWLDLSVDGGTINRLHVLEESSFDTSAGQTIFAGDFSMNSRFNTEFSVDTEWLLNGPLLHGAVAKLHYCIEE